MNNKDINKLTFEESMQRLEQIASSLEKDNIPLEEAVTLYSQGIKLQNHCKNKLANAKMKIEKIVQDEEKIKTEVVTVETKS